MKLSWRIRQKTSGWLKLVVKMKRDNKFVWWDLKKESGAIAKKEKSVKWKGQTKMVRGVNWERQREYLVNAL